MCCAKAFTGSWSDNSPRFTSWGEVNVVLDILVLLFHQDCDACKPNCFQGFLFLQMCIAIHPVQVLRACIVNHLPYRDQKSLSRNCPFRDVSLMWKWHNCGVQQVLEERALMEEAISSRGRLGPDAWHLFLFSLSTLQFCLSFCSFEVLQ
jgi:hypothetical protein